MSSMRSDGKAVDVTVTKTITKGDPTYAEGFYGIAMQDAVSGETIAIEIATREHEINIGSVAGAKGAVLYITSDGEITATSSGNKPFCKVTQAKDANNIVWAVLLGQA